LPKSFDELLQGSCQKLSVVDGFELTQDSHGESECCLDAGSGALILVIIEVLAHKLVGIVHEAFFVVSLSLFLQ
jgi:hypothetical protein